MRSAEKLVSRILEGADIKINGSRPWDLQVHNPALFRRALTRGSLGIGEAYMDGWWDAERVDELVCRIRRADRDGIFRSSLPLARSDFRARLCNMQTRRRSGRVADLHYELSPQFYERLLDPWMQYSCAYYDRVDDLTAAQEAKLALIVRKLNLRAEDRLLDVGCGFGGLSRYAAEKCGCSVSGINLAASQIEYAQRRGGDLPIEYRVADYRELDAEPAGKYSKIVSVGMFEHVGPRNYRRFFRSMHRMLEPGGVFLLQTIGRLTPGRVADPWINRYIFPGGVLPALEQLTAACRGLFVVEDLHNLGAHYDRTLMDWHENLMQNWLDIQKLSAGFDSRFRRMFRFYLASNAGGFRARDLQLWQIVLSKGGIDGGFPNRV